MYKKLIKHLLLFITIAALLTGCAEKTGTGTATATATASESAPSGNISLRVWGSEEDTELVSNIIESFKAEYAGQATFNITYEAHSEANCKDDILGDVLNAPDVFTFADVNGACGFRRVKRSCGFFDNIRTQSSGIE